MKYKILGIVICTLLISSTTTLALTPFNKGEQQKSCQFFNRTTTPLFASNVWMKTFGGAGNDSGASVKQTTDGGYIIGGYTEPNGTNKNDFYLIKIDGNGEKIWEKTFGTVANDDSAGSVQQTTDGGYIIIGTIYPPNSGAKAWLIKTDSNGNQVWEKKFSGDSGYSCECIFGRQTSDGGYIMTGDTNTKSNSIDVLLIKTDDNGSHVWTKCFGGKDMDLGYAVQQTTDGGFIITGWTWSFGSGDLDAWLIKTDTNGNEEWNRTFGKTGDDAGRSVQQVTDGGYIITGSTTPSGSDNYDVWLIKTDSSGNMIWNKTFGGTYMDAGRSVQQTTDGGYIIIGYTFSISNFQDFWLIKTDSNGNEVWDRKFGGKGFDLGRSGQQTSDGGYIITGDTSPYAPGFEDIWLIKTDSEGKSKTLSSVNLWFERLFQRFPHAFPLLR